MFHSRDMHMLLKGHLTYITPVQNSKTNEMQIRKRTLMVESELGLQWRITTAVTASL